LIAGLSGEMPLRPDCPRFCHFGTTKAAFFQEYGLFSAFIPSERATCSRRHSFRCQDCGKDLAKLLLFAWSVDNLPVPNVPNVPNVARLDSPWERWVNLLSGGIFGSGEIAILEKAG
jgi:hypothetical protein